MASERVQRRIDRLLDQAGDFEQGRVYLDRLLEVLQLSPPGPNLEHGRPGPGNSAERPDYWLDRPVGGRRGDRPDHSFLSIGIPQVAQYAVSSLALLAVVRLDEIVAKRGRKSGEQ